MTTVCSALVAAACTGSGDQPHLELDRDDVTLTANLVRFDDCDALLDHLRQEHAVRVGPWGFGGDGWIGLEAATDDMADEEMAAVESTAASEGVVQPAPVEGVDFSGTNVQEQGVDEADIVKTDGRRVITLSSGRLVVADVATRQVLGTADIAAGWSPELFLHGDSLLVVVQTHSEHSGGAESILQRVDLSGGQPEIIDTLRVQGSYLSARSVDGVARVIMRHDPHNNFPFVYPQSEAGEQTAENANRTAILNSTLDDWLPHFAAGNRDAADGLLLTECAKVHAPSVFSGFGVTTVMSVPIDGAFDPSASTAVVAPGDTVYASVESLYVSTTRWLDSSEFDDEQAWERAWQERSTSIHRFDIASGPNAVYEASGELPGVIHNQFSLSEHDGHLRVVTTEGDRWSTDSESFVRVLRQDGDRLVEVGSVGDIGRGEQVQSVRFVGDIGYVVTFRQIDPFYTVDLSDPADPEVIGELKIPGFSSYLHPIGDGLVLGVGADADLDGRITGSKVSLFDVSDLAAPLEIAVWSAPDGWNDVGWDHRAFLWWAPERLAVVPVTVWPDWSGAVVLQVSGGSILEAGRITHADEDAEPGTTDCRIITPEDLPTADRDEFSTETEHIVTEGDGRAIACEQGESGMTGFSCWDDSYLASEVEHLGLLRAGESAYVCWPDYEQNTIVRSIVIGDDLWTLGTKGWGFDGSRESRLEVHDLRTLERLATLPL